MRTKRKDGSTRPSGRRAETDEQMARVKPWVLRRYTSLAAAIHILEKKRITLLDPATWDDRNDAYFLTQYGIRRGGKRVLALCFCEGNQRYHHWRVYANGMDGVCIEFEGKWLLSALDHLEDVHDGPVKYRTLPQMMADPPAVDELPFLKRSGYRDEQEYRLIHVPAEQSAEIRDCEIPLECIRRVILSPWVPRGVKPSIVNVLRSIADCKELRVESSFLVDSEAWQAVARTARKVEENLLADRPPWI